MTKRIMWRLLLVFCLLGTFLSILGACVSALVGSPFIFALPYLLAFGIFMAETTECYYRMTNARVL